MISSDRTGRSGTGPGGQGRSLTKLQRHSGVTTNIQPNCPFFSQMSKCGRYGSKVDAVPFMIEVMAVRTSLPSSLFVSDSSAINSCRSMSRSIFFTRACRPNVILRPNDEHLGRHGMATRPATAGDRH